MFSDYYLCSLFSMVCQFVVIKFVVLPVLPSASFSILLIVSSCGFCHMLFLPTFPVVWVKPMSNSSQVGIYASFLAFCWIVLTSSHSQHLLSRLLCISINCFKTHSALSPLSLFQPHSNTQLISLIEADDRM